MLEEIERQSSEDDEEELAKQIAIVEYYYHTRIDGDYPLLKRLNQYEHLMEFWDFDARRFGLKEG